MDLEQRPRRLRRISAAALLFGILALAILLWSPHRSRLLLGTFETVPNAEQLNTPPNIARNLGFQFAVPAGVRQPTNTFSRALEILNAWDTDLRQGSDAMPIVDRPTTCIAAVASGQRLHCYNVDIAAVTLLGRGGIYARMWDLDGPYGFGGFGHNLVEVWDTEDTEWKVLDPYYHCYYTMANDSGHRPIGLTRLQPCYYQIPEAFPSSDIIRGKASATLRL